MAFYSSRMEDKFSNEVKHSARSFSSLMNCDSLSLNLSSRSYSSTKTSLRNVNSAAFMENVPLTDISSEDNGNCGTMSETQSDIVPPLDLKSEENFPTTRDYTFSYRKHCEGAKIVLEPDKAYETWLSAKRKLMSDKAARRKKEEEMKQRQMEERQRLAKEKYEMWLKKKSQSSTSLPTVSNHSIKTDTNLESRTRLKIAPEEAQARLEKWEKEKRIKEERRRILQRQEEQRRCELEEQRRQMADKAWENWITNASKKPKPVPLNRGFFTLRGTVSDIFVNPHEWKPIIPTMDNSE